MQIVCPGLSPRKTRGHESAARIGSLDLRITHVIASGLLPQLSSVAIEQSTLQIADGGGKSPNKVDRWIGDIWGYKLKVNSSITTSFRWETVEGGIFPMGKSIPSHPGYGEEEMAQGESI